jgi:hypothetical protein
MNRNITTQAAALCLSALVTVCTVLALNLLAGSEHAKAPVQQAAAAASSRA